MYVQGNTIDREKKKNRKKKHKALTLYHCSRTNEKEKRNTKREYEKKLGYNKNVHIRGNKEKKGERCKKEEKSEIMRIFLFIGIHRVAFLSGRRQSKVVCFVGTSLLHRSEHRTGSVEVGVDVTLQEGIICIRAQFLARGLLIQFLSHGRFPLRTELLDLLLVIQFCIVVLADAAHAFPERQVLGVNGRTMVVLLAASAEEVPAALLFLQVETGGVGKEEEGQEHTGQTEPRDHVEFGLGVDVVVQNGCQERTGFTTGRRHTMGCRTNWGGEDLSGNQESDRVGAELVEERAQEIHGLEFLDVLGRCVVIEVEGWNDEQDEHQQESDHLHPLATIELVVDQERGHVVTCERDTHIAQVPQPGRHNRAVIRANDIDEFGLEELVSVEENIVGEPSAGGSKDTEAEILEGQVKRLPVVTGDRALFLGSRQLFASSLHVVGTVVDQPQRAHGRDSKRNTVGPLSGDSRVRRVSRTGVEAQEKNNEDDLVKELTPALHQESAGNFASTVQTVFLG